VTLVLVKAHGTILRASLKGRRNNLSRLYEVSSPTIEPSFYQFITGISLGLTFQVPKIGAQASVKISDLSSASTMLLVSFNQGRLLNLGCTRSIHSLIFLSVPNRASDVNPAEVLAAVPASLRKAFTSEQLPGVTCHAWCIQEAQGHRRRIRRKHVVTVMVYGIGE
jgi:hypothetical protein